MKQEDPSSTVPKYSFPSPLMVPQRGMAQGPQFTATAQMRFMAQGACGHRRIIGRSDTVTPSLHWQCKEPSPGASPFQQPAASSAPTVTSGTEPTGTPLHRGSTLTSVSEDVTSSRCKFWPFSCKQLLWEKKYILKLHLFQIVQPWVIFLFCHCTYVYI